MTHKKRCSIIITVSVLILAICQPVDIFVGGVLLEAKFTIEKANEAIKQITINKKYYPKLNFAAPAGWINDPNGVVFFNNEIHLFYQHYPYDSVHGKMHWGHAKSKDGLNWEHLNVALAPDKPYDKDGVFSGSAIEKNGKLYLLYSGNIEYEKDKIKQTQNIAISEDGIHFEKYENNPVIDHNDIPAGTSKFDFRDPKVFKKDGKYYAVIGSKTEDDKGQVLMYASYDLLEWEFISIVLPYNKYLGDMVECPDLIFFEEKDVILLSAMNYTDEITGEFHPHISWVVEGNMNWMSYTFEMTHIRKMDEGFDFYAPQTASIAQSPNEYVAIAWQQAWNRTLPSHDEKHGWSGQMTLPRKLSLIDGKLLQEPYPKILENKLVIQSFKQHNFKNMNKFPFKGNIIEFNLKDNQCVDFFLENDEKSGLYLKFDKENKEFFFSRKNTVPIIGYDDKIYDEKLSIVPIDNDIWSISIYVDTSSVQIFINNYFSFTSTFYVKQALSHIILGDYKEVECIEIATL